MRVHRQLKSRVQPDLIPMIDIVFQLVVFFMVSSTFVVAPGIGLELPESTTEEQVSMDLYQVTMTREGLLFFQEEQVSEEQLGQRLAALSDEQKERVIVQGEQDVALQQLVAVLDILRSRGIRNASILAKNPLPSDAASGPASGAADNPADVSGDGESDTGSNDDSGGGQ
jgi:biopolymer transport protein ExbD